MKKEKPFGFYLQQIATRDLYDVFDDFLTICIYCLSNRQNKEEYSKMIKKYSPDEINLFSQAFVAMGDEADNRGYGFKDPFGDYYMEHFSQKSKGQFFTPQYLCDLMEKVTGTMESARNFYDPCVGSGRTFLSIGKKDITREKYYVGADISLICCKMCLVNMCLNSMKGEVLWMDSLDNKIWRKWLIVVDNVLKFPFIYEVKGDDNPEPEDAVFIEEKPKLPKIKPAVNIDNEKVQYVVFS